MDLVWCVTEKRDMLDSIGEGIPQEWDAVEAWQQRFFLPLLLGFSRLGTTAGCRSGL